MVRTCTVCKKQFFLGDGRSYHRLPKQPDTREKWCLVLQQFKISRYSCVCSDHFKSEDFYFGPSGRRLLKLGSIPSIIDAPEYKETSCQKTYDKYLWVPPSSASVKSEPAEECDSLSVTSVAATETTLTPQKTFCDTYLTYLRTSSSPPLAVREEIVECDSLSVASVAPTETTLTASECEDRIEEVLSPDRVPDVGLHSEQERVKLMEGSDSSSMSLGPSSTLTASEFEDRMAEVRSPSVSSLSGKSDHLQQTLYKRKRRRVRYFGDMSSADLGSPKSARIHWPIIERTVENQRRRIKTLERINLRLRNKVFNLTSLLKFMKQKYGLQENIETIIKG